MNEFDKALRALAVHGLGKFHCDLEDFGWSIAEAEQAFGPVAQRWRGY